VLCLSHFRARYNFGDTFLWLFCCWKDFMKCNLMSTLFLHMLFLFQYFSLFISRSFMLPRLKNWEEYSFYSVFLSVCLFDRLWHMLFITFQLYRNIQPCDLDLAQNQWTDRGTVFIFYTTFPVWKGLYFETNICNQMTLTFDLLSKKTFILFDPVVIEAW